MEVGARFFNDFYISIKVGESIETTQVAIVADGQTGIFDLVEHEEVDDNEGGLG